MSQPWFKFFASDYLLDPAVDALALDAQAVLLRMWCLCHLEGSCPADSGEIARKARLSLQSVRDCREQLSRFFDERDGRLFSHRMMREKQKSEAARTSIAYRWNGRLPNRSTDRNTNRSSIRATQSQSQSQSQNQSQNQNQKLMGAVAPTLAQVAAYCAERKNGIDPQQWLDHYSANGWRVGKNPMKDWRAAVRTWERNGVNIHGNRRKPNRAEQRQVDNLANLDTALPVDR